MTWHVVLCLAAAAQESQLGQEELAAAEEQCDAGVQAKSSITGEDLTLAVYSCPPAHCEAFSCAGYELASKGVQGCLNTSAPVGTIFELEFVVLDPAVTPPVSSRVIRTVTILPPCQQGFSYCRCVSPRRFLGFMRRPCLPAVCTR